MKVLLISKEADGLGVAHRLTMEGHSVDVWIKDPRYERALMGIVNHVSDWQRVLKSTDLVLVDMVGFGRFEELLRASGKPFLGASLALDKVELDRAVGMDMFRRAGVDIPETLSFSRPGEVALQPPWGLGWVVKPCGNLSTAKTFVVKEEEMWEHAIAKVPPECSLIIQRIVEGVEVSTEGWFNGRSFIRPFNHTFEEKRFLNGNLGCNTGCMGNVVVAKESNKLTRRTVERFEPFLRMIGYRGAFDVNCIVNQRGAYALEATSRMGYDAVEALAELLDEPLGDLLFETAAGVKREMALGPGFSVAVRLSVPPWPVQNPDHDSWGEPVLGLSPEVLEHVFLCDVLKDGSGYKTAAGDGVLLKATARSSNLSLARRKVYRLLETIKVEGKQYRTDIGERVSDDMDHLRAWGWLS